MYVWREKEGGEGAGWWGGQWKFSYVLSSEGVLMCCFCVVYALGIELEHAPSPPKWIGPTRPKEFALGLASISP